jgi:hypothetical protein
MPHCLINNTLWAPILKWADTSKSQIGSAITHLSASDCEILLREISLSLANLR